MSKKPKTLVTHLFPHLDDVAGFWLLKRFDPACKNARLKFLPTTAKGLRLSAREIGVGVGRGKYDEHKGDRKDSATSLIWKDLKRRRHLPSGIVGRALAMLVDYVRRGDLGEYIGDPMNFVNLSGTLQTIAGLPKQDSQSASKMGLIMTDALLRTYVERTKVVMAIERGHAFKTRWGRGIGIVTDAIPQTVSSVTAELGYQLVALEHPSRRYVHVRAHPKSKADLTKLAKYVRRIDADDEWFFHQSKKMLIHGDLVAPTSKRSRFHLSDMVKLIRHLYA